MFIEKEAGQEDHLVARNGVYFTKMLVNSKYLEKPTDPPGNDGFGRPGHE